MDRADDGTRPVVLLDPAPQTRERIFAPADWERLQGTFRVIEIAGMSAPSIDELLGEAFALVGQTDLSEQRLDRAPRLRAICNVEGNFFPNIAYQRCFERGIYVLGCGRAYAEAVAEYALGLAIDLCRGITRCDRAFRAGVERYLAEGNRDAISLLGARVGFIGFGHLARALRPLLQPFRTRISCFDPWVPDNLLREAGVEPASLDQVLSQSDLVFVLAASTSENESMLDARALDLPQRGTPMVFVSRSAVVDLPALLERVADGRLTAAVDVWPTEPLAFDDPARHLQGLVLSAHLAGAMPAAFQMIGSMVVDDLLQVRRGLPPMRMQVATRELISRYRSRPVTGRERHGPGHAVP